MNRYLLSFIFAAASLSAFADYEVNFPEGTQQTATNPQRTLNSVTFAVGNLPAQTVNVGQVSGGDLFIDLTKQCVVLTPGANVKIDFNWSGNWMNSYVYLDQGNDGKFDATLTADNLPDSTGDILAFSNLNNKNSAGEDALDSKNVPGNSMLLPEFNLGDLKPGLYRMRFKVDYNEIDPAGRTSDDETKPHIQLGGCIADVMAWVMEPATPTSLSDITLKAENGSLALSGLDADGNFTVSGTADDKYVFSGVNVINTLEAPAEAAFADPTIGSSSVEHKTFTGSVELNLSDFYSNGTIEGIFLDNANSGTFYDYDSDFAGVEKDAAKGFTTLIVNDEEVAVNSTTAYTFLNKKFNIPVGGEFSISAKYSGVGARYRVYVDTDFNGSFGNPIADSSTFGRMGKIKLPDGTQPGVYRARLEAAGNYQVDFLINVYDPTANYRCEALNGIILAADGSVLAESFPALTELKVKALPTLPGFETDEIIVRHGHGLTGSEYIAGNPQWVDNVLKLDEDGTVTIPGSLIDGDFTVYVLFKEAENSEWTKVWGDEFSTDAVDSKRWGYNERYGAAWNYCMAINAEQRAKTNIMANGYYNSYALPASQFPGETAPMVTGAIISQRLLEVRYGKIEARAKTNPWVGSFPAFWMMPAESKIADTGYNTWPNNGEIDIWEQINTQQAAHGTIHSGWANWNTDNKGWPAPGKSSPAKTGSISSDPSQWHVYALEWEADELRWYIDGKQFFSYKNQHYAQEGSPYYTEAVTWPFDKKFYIILNQSVGNGSWAAKPDTNHEYHTQFDYVRVYQKKNNPDYQLMNALGTNGDDPNFYVPATNVYNGDSTESGIDEVSTVEFDGSAVYFDLSGRRVNAAALTPGIYIEQRGSKATKVVIR
ncbi:MAG: glycoside hydrolase family 16 protein [Bacteroides sp.]|nr:glycoside hydrolase family 16 protein [Bacteroides sp.]MCM1379708.1 glycoside hydrolase family 16 protein [Bacteroides sp.]MCM1446063.1 glycoside hydrolase family 16 protein [Prevotella sp.]